MPKDLPEFLGMLRRRDGASDELVDNALATLPVSPPSDYLDFMRISNGAEGALPGTYLQLWPLDTLAQRNAAYAVEEFAPGLVLIGSDGGDTAYALASREGKTVFAEVPFIGMAPDAVAIRGESFREFIASITADVE